MTHDLPPARDPAERTGAGPLRVGGNASAARPAGGRRRPGRRPFRPPRARRSRPAPRSTAAPTEACHSGPPHVSSRSPRPRPRPRSPPRRADEHHGVLAVSRDGRLLVDRRAVDGGRPQGLAGRGAAAGGVDCDEVAVGRRHVEDAAGERRGGRTFAPTGVSQSTAPVAPSRATTAPPARPTYSTSPGPITTPVTVVSGVAQVGQAKTAADGGRTPFAASSGNLRTPPPCVTPPPPSGRQPVAGVEHALRADGHLADRPAAGLLDGQGPAADLGGPAHVDHRVAHEHGRPRAERGRHADDDRPPGGLQDRGDRAGDRRAGHGVDRGAFPVAAQVPDAVAR